MNLSDELKSFNTKRLKKSTTKVKTVDGTEFVETKVGEHYTKNLLSKNAFCGFVVDNNPDLEVAKISEHLYFGSQDVAANFNLLIKFKITNILTLVPNFKPIFPKTFSYKILPLLDTPEFEIRSHFNVLNDYIKKCLSDAKVVFVHCNAGLSRAPTVIAAYLIKNEMLTTEQALDTIKKVRKNAQPNAGFLKQLKLYELEFH